MVGIIFAALFIFKKAMNGNRFSKKSSYLQVEETLNLSQRKTLYVVKAGGQKFLLAGDTERTSLIAKLGGDIETIKEKTNEEVRTETISELYRQDKSAELTSLDGIESMDEFASIIDFNFRKEPNVNIEKTENIGMSGDFGSFGNYSKSGKRPMMKELARKLSSM